VAVAIGAHGWTSRPHFEQVPSSSTIGPGQQRHGRALTISGGGASTGTGRRLWATWRLPRLFGFLILGVVSVLLNSGLLPVGGSVAIR
jgi:hypothetical protein